MTTPTTDIAAAYSDWADALEGFGEHLTQESGDSIPLITSLLGTAYVAVNNGGIREVLDPDEVGDAEDFLNTYSHIVDAAVAQLVSMGWIEPALCEGCDCGAIVPMPAFPVCRDCREGRCK